MSNNDRNVTAGGATRYSCMSLRRPHLLPALLIAFTVLVAAFGLVPLEETAAVRIAAPVQRLQTNVLIDLPARHI